jgi:peptidoglycan/xylan/chitin deacetylase (PgdA/CDA1 family)
MGGDCSVSRMFKSRKALKEIPIEIMRFFQRSYPAFVLASSPEPRLAEVPVFMFHAVEHDRFAAQLAFLQRNEYRTLTMREFMAFLRGDRQLNQPSVLLSFDDGHKSLYQVAYPLLKAYGFRAVGFLVSSYIREWPSPGAWLSWPEVLEMEQSGVMTFESHTAKHDRVFVGPEVVDFYHPGFERNPLGLDTPWVDELSGYTNRLRWGTPIHVHASRYSGQRRYLDDATMREACVAWVNAQGGEAFFVRRSWRRALFRHYETIVDKGRPLQYESKAAQCSTILHDLGQSRRVLSEKLGRPVRHLCYPWGSGSEAAVALSREAGYVSNFWVTSKRRNSNRLGDDPFHIPRLKDDYLFRLPGAGRHPLMRIVLMKMHRRIQREYIY